MFAKAIDHLRQIDWRIFFGIIVTVLWLIAGLFYMHSTGLSYETIYRIPLDDLGSFLEGGFAPLAFLWLVIGLFIQQRELADNTEVLRQTSIQSEKQTQAIAATEMNARQETFFKIAENVRSQLGGVTGMLYISSMGATEGQLVPRERIEKLWHMLARGDDQVFAREFLLLDPEEFGGYEALFYKTDIRRRHTKNFMTTFDRLMVMARDCDSDNGIIADTMAQTAHGLLYRRMRDHRPADMDVECSDVDTADYEKILEHTLRS